jgi:hypothetical protein
MRMYSHCVSLPLSIPAVNRAPLQAGQLGNKKRGQATYFYFPAQQKNIYAGCSKRPFSKAAASEGARRTLRYVEPLSDARTPLGDFFSILLEQDRYPFFPSA